MPVSESYNAHGLLRVFSIHQPEKGNSGARILQPGEYEQVKPVSASTLQGMDTKQR